MGAVIADVKGAREIFQSGRKIPVESAAHIAQDNV